MRAREKNWWCGCCFGSMEWYSPFCLSYEEDGIKFYPNYSKLLSIYYDFNPDVDPRKFTDVMYKGSIYQDYYGKFKEDEVDDIIL